MSITSIYIEQNFLKLHEAIQADGYRVTLVHFDIESEKEDYKQDLLNFVYGTKGNLPLPPDQIIPHIPALAARCSKIIYEKGKMLTCGVWFTPLSKDRHHPAIDDVNTPAKLAALEKSGLSSCAIIESSPGNRQYVYTVPRLEPIPTIFTDKIPKDEAANAIAYKLNTLYGDPGATGIQRPFRWPGFQNRKPKHQKNGQFPTVNLLYTNPCQCPTWQEMITTEYAAQADLRASRINLDPGIRDNAILAYNAHRDDILSHNPDTHYINYDIMIATRLAVTGFTEEAIADAIFSCTPRKKGGERAYADSTASNAFGNLTDKEQAKKMLWRIIESGDAYYKNDDAPAVKSLIKQYDNARFVFDTHEEIVTFAGMILFWLGYSRQCIEKSIAERYPELDAYACAKEATGTQFPETTRFCMKNLKKWQVTESLVKKNGQ